MEREWLLPGQDWGGEAPGEAGAKRQSQAIEQPEQEENEDLAGTDSSDHTC